MLDRLLKLSSLSGALLIFCGVLKLIIYYSAFNIRIVEFLSFSEIIMSFLDDINVLIIYCLALFLQSVPTINFIHRKTKSNLSVIDWMDLQMLQIFPFKTRYAIIFLLAISIFLTLIIFNFLEWSYWIIYLLVFCIMQAMAFLMMTRSPEFKIELSGTNIGLILFTAIVSAIFFLAKHDIQITKANNYDVTIKTEDSIFICNKTTGNVYIGKTDNYIFIETYPDKSTVCIPNSLVKRIEFK